MAFKSCFIHSGLDVTERMSDELFSLKSRFGSMMRKAKMCLEKRVDIDDLKDQLFYSHHSEGINRAYLSKYNSIREVFEEIILPRCTVANYTMLICLATELGVHEIKDAAKEFEKNEAENFKTCLREELGSVMNEEEARHQSNSDLPKTEIRLEVDLDWHEATLTEFRNLVRRVFPGLRKWIHLKVVYSGCVCFTCWAPKHLEAVLIQMAEEQQDIAKKMRVILLQVGGTVIFDITETQVISIYLFTTVIPSIMVM